MVLAVSALQDRGPLNASCGIGLCNIPGSCGICVAFRHHHSASSAGSFSARADRASVTAHHNI